MNQDEINNLQIVDAMSYYSDIFKGICCGLVVTMPGT